MQAELGSNCVFTVSSLPCAADEAGKEAFRLAGIQRVRTRQQYLRMLYWAAEGTADSLRDAIPVLTALYQSVGNLPADAAAAAAGGTDAPASTVSTLPWSYSRGLLDVPTALRHDISRAVYGDCLAC